MRWSEGLAGQVCYPVTELVVTRRDKATLFTVKGVTDGKPRLTVMPSTVNGTELGAFRRVREIGLA